MAPTTNSAAAWLRAYLKANSSAMDGVQRRAVSTTSRQIGDITLGELIDGLEETLRTPVQEDKPYFNIGHKTAAYILSIIDQ